MPQIPPASHADEHALGNSGLTIAELSRQVVKSIEAFMFRR
jgi:hypothetical protein